MRNWFFWLKPKTPLPKRACQQCRSTSWKHKSATYPVFLDGALKGKRLDIYRVDLHQCRQCGHLMPTRKGRAKINRCTKTGIEFFRNQKS